MHVVVRYHEIALKGKNRPFFVEQLVQNLRRRVSDLGVPEVRPTSSRVVIRLASDEQWPAVRDRVAETFGVANFSPAYEAVSHMLGSTHDGAETTH